MFVSRRHVGYVSDHYVGGSSACDVSGGREQQVREQEAWVGGLLQHMDQLVQEAGMRSVSCSSECLLGGLYRARVSAHKEEV